jgi:hypothetical protein
MDKVNREGVPGVERLNFLPLLSVEAAPADRRGLLRRGRLEPFEPFYLGNVPEVGESYVVLSEVYALPAAYFGPSIQSFEDHPSAAEDAQRYLVATRNDSRLARLSDEQLEMLKDKVNAYWTRRLPEPPDPASQG